MDGTIGRRRRWRARAGAILAHALLVGGLAVAAPADAAPMYGFSVIDNCRSGEPHSALSPPSIDRGLVAYFRDGRWNEFARLVVAQPATGQAVTVDQLGTPIPGGSGRAFGFFRGTPSIDGGTIAFLGGSHPGGPGGSADLGVYVGRPNLTGGYTISTVAEMGRLVPNYDQAIPPSRTFADFASPFIADGDIVFKATDPDGKPGIDRLPAGDSDLFAVADTTTPVPFVDPALEPGLAGNFRSFTEFPTTSAGVVAFAGASDGFISAGRYQAGISPDGTAVADRNSDLSGPGIDTLFPASPSVSAGDVAFLATFGAYPGGPYTDAFYLITAAGPSGVLAPSTGGLWPALDKGLLALVPDGYGTIYSNLGLAGPSPSPLISVGQALDEDDTTDLG